MGLVMEVGSASLVFDLKVRSTTKKRHEEHEV